MSVLLAKLLLAPALVVGSSLAGRRWGPALAGALVALPLVAGPILLITAIEHGVHFGARAAGSSLLGIVALALFALVFARLAPTRSWPVALIAGWLAFLALAIALSTLDLSPLPALALAVCALALARALMGEEPQGDRRSRPLPAWDLPARALATAMLVVGVTSSAAALGPTLTGVLAPFPVATSVLAAFVLAQEGAGQASAMLAGFLRGAFGFAAFSYLLAVLLSSTGTFVAFTVALGGALSLQLLARLALVRTPGARRA